ncbi:MAG TPA: TonB family protein [Pyrinomonadaceae bacterium]|nr:TonB family protein [Pyrinomonadaceae bacterium]
MKTKTTFVITLALLVSACSLIPTPTATVKKFLTAAQKGDTDAMTKLFSQKAQQRVGLETIQADNKQFAERVRQASAVGGNYRMENVQETASPEGKRVSFVYKNEKGTDAFGLAFDLSKEESVWKIDNVRSAELETSSSKIPPIEPPLVAPAPFPQQPSEDSQADKKLKTSGAPISAGVLNGKALSLPKPPYPPLARAAKAGGMVVVQVTVDEQGNVISARAVSGHPLLQAAAVAAARAAKFSPTKLSGEPVKVSGVLTYTFTAPVN